MIATKPKWRLNHRRFRETGEKRWHKAHVPGTIRVSRLPGGPGFRGVKQWKQVRYNEA